jgi:hypothetical protein
MDITSKEHANQVIMKNEASRKGIPADCGRKTKEMKRITIERKSCRGRKKL